LSLILDFSLIPRYGAVGAAIGGAITIVFVNLLRLIQVNQLLHIHPYSLSYLKPVLSGIIATFITLIINWLFIDVISLWTYVSLSVIFLTIYVLVIILLPRDQIDQELFNIFRTNLNGFLARQ